MKALMLLSALLVPLAGPALAQAAEKGPEIDIVFALDTTGSMADEITLVRRLVWDLANGLISGSPHPSLRLGLVRYRDRGDIYVTKVSPLTFDLDAIYQDLMQTTAEGGGDEPEHVSEALNRAVSQRWRSGGVKRLVFLIGDAGPKDYGDYFVDKEARRAHGLGVAIHAIGCSGLESADQEAFRKIATLSGGTYAPLARGGAAVGSASDVALRNLVLTRAGLGRYAAAAAEAARRKPPLARRATPTPPSSDTRDRTYAPTPDRVWKSTVE